MKAPQDIILRPIVTERSMAGIPKHKYTFEVAKTANKIEIGQAVEKLFPGNQVEKVNTICCRGHFKRYGVHQGYTSSWKKAIVTLTDKSKGIEFFESMI